MGQSKQYNHSKHRNKFSTCDLIFNSIQRFLDTKMTRFTRCSFCYIWQEITACQKNSICVMIWPGMLLQIITHDHFPCQKGTWCTVLWRYCLTQCRHNTVTVPINMKKKKNIFFENITFCSFKKTKQSSFNQSKLGFAQQDRLCSDCSLCGTIHTSTIRGCRSVECL